MFYLTISSISDYEFTQYIPFLIVKFARMVSVYWESGEQLVFFSSLVMMREAQRSLDEAVRFEHVPLNALSPSVRESGRDHET